MGLPPLRLLHLQLESGGKPTFLTCDSASYYNCLEAAPVVLWNRKSGGKPTCPTCDSASYYTCLEAAFPGVLWNRKNGGKPTFLTCYSASYYNFLEAASSIVPDPEPSFWS